MTERVAERGTKTKPAEGDVHPNDSKQKKSNLMLKEDAGTQMKTEGVPRQVKKKGA